VGSAGNRLGIVSGQDLPAVVADLRESGRAIARASLGWDAMEALLLDEMDRR
jgi:hypothetical protein